MPRRRPSSAPQPPGLCEQDPGAARAPGGDAAGPGGPAMPSLAELGIAGVSRRRIAWVSLAALAAWIVLGFAGQAAEASRATGRVSEEQALTAQAVREAEALRRELQLVTEERWILQQARAYQLGSPKERPFALAPDAPALADDAPGSALRAVGAETEKRSPLESWLVVLFGPRD